MAAGGILPSFCYGMSVMKNKDQRTVLRHLNFFNFSLKGCLVKFRQTHGLGSHPLQNFLRDLLGVTMGLSFLVKGTA